MNAHDLVDLWMTHLNLAMTLFAAFLSATSAFLLVAHFKDGELRKSLYRIVLSLYVVAVTFFLLLFAKTLEGALDVRGQMREAGVDWYNTVYEVQWIAPTVFTIGFFVQVLLAAGAIWYFRSTREPGA